MADSRIKSASEILSAFFDRDLVKQGEYYALFDRSWKSIAGQRLSPHSRPTEIKHGVLIVETEHQGWMQLLQLQQDRMLSEIQRRFPDLGVRSIAFRLGNSDGLERLPRGRKAQVEALPPESKPDAGAEAPQEDKMAEPSEARTEQAQGGRAEAEAKTKAAPPSPSALPREIRDLFEKIRKNIRR
ncbi:MAG: DUF721 domain-containing protein [Spirochaetia bacterium]|jgi:hypothetical protein|nr:DUF721 domain-containing protein [Spirochaetia bacterium]